MGSSRDSLVVECLPSAQEVLGLIPISADKGEGRNEERTYSTFQKQFRKRVE